LENPASSQPVKKLNAESPQVVVPKEQTVQKVRRASKRRKERAEEKRTTFFERFLNLSLKVTHTPSKTIANRLPNLRDDILSSNLNLSLEGIVSVSLFIGLLFTPVAAGVGLLLYELHLVLFILVTPIIPIIPVALGIAMIKVSMSSRSQALDNELPYLIGYITVLAGGGISPIVTIKRIAGAYKLFPAAAREGRRILADIEIFGLDAISALERAAKYCPNKMFSDFIGGYVSVLKTGGDAVSYLEAKLREIFVHRESRVKSSSEFIGNMAESYIIATVVMGVGLMILFAVQNLLNPNGGGATPTGVPQHIDPTMIILFSGLFVPVISMVFIIVIGSAQIKEPFSYDFQFYIFMASLPIAAVAFFVNFGLPLYLQLAIGLALTSTPAMLVNMAYTRKRKSVEAKLPNFLRDISEIRKTGLAPEKTIEQLANRNYGGLSPHIKLISTQLSWGTPIRTVLENFSEKVKSWLTRAMTFLLLEVVDVGGGSPKMFISLADFMEKNAQLEKERRSMVRPYIIIPYIGAVMIVVTTAMMIYFVSSPSLSFPGSSAFLPSPAIINQAKNILLTAAVFQAWIMGLVAGKMGEGSMADGFKHATIITIVGIITILTSSLLIGLIGA
jgi:archaeal flagellar protein FlaJ